MPTAHYFGSGRSTLLEKTMQQKEIVSRVNGLIIALPAFANTNSMMERFRHEENAPIMEVREVKAAKPTTTTASKKAAKVIRSDDGEVLNEDALA